MTCGNRRLIAHPGADRCARARRFLARAVRPPPPAAAGSRARRRWLPRRQPRIPPDRYAGGGWPGTGTSVSDRVESALADDQLPHRLLVVGHRRRPPRPLAGIGGATAGGSGRRGRVGAGGLLAEAHRFHLSHDAAVELLGGTPDQEPAAGCGRSRPTEADAPAVVPDRSERRRGARIGDRGIPRGAGRWTSR